MGNKNLKMRGIWLRVKPDLGQIGIFNISDHYISRPSFIHRTLSPKRSILTLKSTMAPSNNPSESHIALTYNHPELDGALLTAAYHSTDDIKVFQARTFEKEKHNVFVLFNHTDDTEKAGIGLINFTLPK